MSAMRLGDRLECIQSVLAGFADTNEDSRREGDREFARPLERVESALRDLVRCTAVTLEVIAQSFDHHSLRWRDVPQHRELVAVQRTGIRVRQETRLGEHERCHLVQVMHRGVVSVV